MNRTEPIVVGVVAVVLICAFAFLGLSRPSVQARSYQSWHEGRRSSEGLSIMERYLMATVAIMFFLSMGGMAYESYAKNQCRVDAMKVGRSADDIQKICR
jgi:hypothetical protein